MAAIVKIQIPAGQATPAPPVGTALGPHGINIMDFCKAYNAATENQRGMVIPAEISIFEDRSFTFVTKTPPTPFLLRQAAGIEKGAQNARTDKAGQVTHAQVRQIAETKMPDLNAIDLEGAVAQVAGTARSMGIEIATDRPYHGQETPPAETSPGIGRRGSRTHMASTASTTMRSRVSTASRCSRRPRRSSS